MGIRALRIVDCGLPIDGLSIGGLSIGGLLIGDWAALATPTGNPHSVNRQSALGNPSIDDPQSAIGS
jgi:hypothetical protein